MEPPASSPRRAKRVRKGKKSRESIGGESRFLSLKKKGARGRCKVRRELTAGLRQEDWGREAQKALTLKESGEGVLFLKKALSLYTGVRKYIELRRDLAGSLGGGGGGKKSRKGSVRTTGSVKVGVKEARLSRRNHLRLGNGLLRHL